MARGATWTNFDGLSVGFGTLDSKNPNGAMVRTQGNVNIMQFPFSYDASNYEIGTDTPSTKSVPIPANSTILRGQLQVTTAFAGGTNYDFGLMEADGTEIDDDGLDAAVALADIDAVNDIITFDGGLIGANVGTADAYFGVVTTGTFTAGEGIVTVEYVLEMADSLPTDPIYTAQGSI